MLHLGGLVWECDDGPGGAVAEVEFLTWELARGEELRDVGARGEGLAGALGDVDLGDWDLVLALGGEVVEEPEVGGFGGGGGVLGFEAVAAAGEEGVGLLGLEVGVWVEAGFVVVDFEALGEMLVVNWWWRFGNGYTEEREREKKK